MGALLVTLIPFPCAGGAAGSALPTVDGAAPQLLPHRLPGQKRAWWDSTKSCGAHGELWNEMGSGDHSPGTSPGSVSSQGQTPSGSSAPGFCAVCSL